MKQLRKLLITSAFILGIFLILPVIAGNTNYSTIQAATIKISKTSKKLYVGYGMKLNMIGTSKKAIWTSGDTSIATVSPNGYVKAKKKGITTITGKVKGKKYKCNITVNQNAYLDLYSTKKINFVGYIQKTTYTSSNKKVATIDKEGKITAKKIGTTTITAKLKNGKKYSLNLVVRADGWIKDQKGKWYYYKNNKRLEGWNYIGKYKYYFYKNCGRLDQNVADRLKGEQEYYIHVNRKQCKITIFAKDGDKGFTIPVLAMTCSVGTKDHATPTGTFNTMSKTRWGALMLDSYGQYCTRIVGSILFHSVPGSRMSSYNVSASLYNKLGKPASHGCIRLCVRDAKWIYDNCKIKTKVTIDDKSDGCKFDKPKLKKIKSTQHYDPTDPDIKK